MEKKYIIKLEDDELAYQTIIINGMPYIKPLRLLPYTDTLRMDVYRKGLADAWEAAKKIYLPIEYGGIPADALRQIFDNKSASGIFKKVSASECIEKIQQYEQEKDRQARIEYNFDEIKDVLETTAKECNVSLDEIAEVLQKMKEANNG